MVTREMLDRVRPGAAAIRQATDQSFRHIRVLDAAALCNLGRAVIEGREALAWAKTYGISAHNLMTADPLRVEELVVADRWAARVAALSRILDAIPEGGPAEEDS